MLLIFFPDFYKDNFTAALQRPKIVKNTTVIIKKKILKEFYAFTQVCAMRKYFTGLCKYYSFFLRNKIVFTFKENRDNKENIEK